MSEWDNYWVKRGNLNYYKVARERLEKLGAQHSLLDIGCTDTPVAMWGTFTERYSLDRHERPELAGVKALIGTWPDVEVGRTFSVITCLQVLEHLPTEIIPRFVEAIFKRSDVALLSVPWMWRAGKCAGHLQDLIDVTKFLSWCGRDPLWLEIVTDNGFKRIVAEFTKDRNDS